MKSIFSDCYDGKRRRLFEIHCQQCQQSVWAPAHANRKFCSQECSQRGHMTRSIFECGHCKKSFYRRKSLVEKLKKRPTFCSRRCKDLSQRIDGVRLIRPRHYGDGRGALRNRAFRQYGKQCTRCGYDANEKMLDCDHENGRGNNIENLTVLCVWCHAIKTRKVIWHPWISPLSTTGDRR